MDADAPFDSQAEEEEEEEKETRSQQLARLNPILLEACRCNHTSNIISLIEEMADPMVEDENQWSPIIWASSHGNEEVLRRLLVEQAHAPYQRAGTSLESMGMLPGSPSSASGGPRPSSPTSPVAASMIAGGCGVGKKKHTPLHWAAYRGHLRIVWLLLQQKMSPIESDGLGNTVLHQAAAGGDHDVTAVILSQGADVFMKNKRGHTAFDMCTNVPTQKLLHHCMQTKACVITSKGFSATVLRYLCSWTHAVVCKEAAVRMWVYENAKRNEKEKPLTLSREAKETVDTAERMLEVANKVEKTEDLDQVIAALENAEGKPVDAKLHKATTKLRGKLESTIRLHEAMANKSIIKPEVEEIIPADDLAMAADNLARAIQDAIRRRAEKSLTDTGANLRRRLLCEANLSRYLVATPKLTVGYIRYFQELIDACITESGNQHLIKLSTAFRKRISAERAMTLKFDEVEELCKLSSIEEVPMDEERNVTDKKYPEWIADIEKFSAFQEEYVKDVEYGRETISSETLVAKCEAQLTILEDLLMEQRQITEEVNLKKKKGKGAKKK
ncbi:unnamed protein product [Amoebophrya sp. A25]|nr:unnamed protein product [Amoebophrya sp. A25]|eukprot:GSA25T00008450001.1